MPPRLRPILALAGLLLFALACGSGDKSTKTPAGGSTLGDLMGDGGVATPTPATPAALPTPPVTPSIAAPAEAAVAAATLSTEPAACKAARDNLKRRRAEVDAQRAGKMEGAEASLSQAQGALNACMSSPDCMKDGKRFVEFKKSADSAAARYQSVMNAMGDLEASLFPLNQAVDQACGRE